MLNLLPWVQKGCYFLGFQWISVQIPPEDRFRTLAFSKYLCLLVQALLNCRWDTFPMLQFLVHWRRRWELAGFCQLRASAREPQGVWGPSPPSSFILPIHCSALFNHKDEGKELFHAFRETFHGTGKGLSVIFWRIFWFPGKYSFLKSKWITYPTPLRNPTLGGKRCVKSWVLVSKTCASCLGFPSHCKSPEMSW